jgi:glycosyltransferase involved in cell wall biosynthesis
MKLSIILPVYNMEKYLHRSLNSLLSQDTPKNEYEIIIVNDESKDNSLQIVNDFLKIQTLSWGRKQGFKYRVIGGGLADDDGLYQHKKNSSPTIQI